MPFALCQTPTSPGLAIFGGAGPLAEARARDSHWRLGPRSGAARGPGDHPPRAVQRLSASDLAFVRMSLRARACTSLVPMLSRSPPPALGGGGGGGGGGGCPRMCWLIGAALHRRPLVKIRWLISLGTAGRGPPARVPPRGTLHRRRPGDSYPLDPDSFLFLRSFFDCCRVCG